VIKHIFIGSVGVFYPYVVFIETADTLDNQRDHNTQFW